MRDEGGRKAGIRAVQLPTPPHIRGSLETGSSWLAAVDMEAEGERQGRGTGTRAVCMVHAQNGVVCLGTTKVGRESAEWA